MISFSIHIPSIIIGILLGYIFVSIMWIVNCTCEKWETGFGEGYKAGRRVTKDEFEETKECKNSVETEKQYMEGANGLMKEAMKMMKNACRENKLLSKCEDCPFDEYCDQLAYSGSGIPQMWKIE